MGRGFVCRESKNKYVQERSGGEAEKLDELGLRGSLSQNHITAGRRTPNPVRVVKESAKINK